MKLGSFILLSFLIFACSTEKQPNVQITISDELASEVKDGRLLLLMHHSDQTEPRFAVSDDVGSAQVIGMDFEDHKQGEAFTFDLNNFGYPIENFKDIPEGEYWVQAYVVKYETFNRADGHTIKMPMDQWEGRQWV